MTHTYGDMFIKRKYRSEQQQELRRKITELQRQYHEQIYKEWKSRYPEYKIPYRNYHRHIHYVRPVLITAMIAFWGFLFLFGEFPIGIRIVIATFAVFSTVEGLAELVFLLHLDNRILRPLESLELAARRIEKGDFTVRVNAVSRRPEIEDFVKTFNEMAATLQKNEQLKKEYEENRKKLIANISHDLKTPVTVVLGYVDALHDLPPENQEKMEKYLSVIKSNTIYLNRLIDDLFLFSKLDIHRLNLNFETVILNNYLADLMEEISLDLEEQKIAFYYSDLLPGKTTARIDSKQFCRIVRNIVDNAKRYGPPTGLRIEITAKVIHLLPDSLKTADSTENAQNMQYSRYSYFCLSITDNGSGFPADKLVHIFDRFYRVDAERTKHVESTGLGLAIAKELTEAHGGTIQARNVPSSGLAFDIQIPLTKQQEGNIL